MLISNAFPPWLTQTKTLPIRQRISLIERPELCRRLNSGLGQKLSLLIAPAGFGKTTLLSQWRENLLISGATVAWLTIDDDDNEPAIFALYLAYALATAGLEKDIIDLHPKRFDPNTPPRTILGILLSAIAKQEQKIVLIIDNIEKLNENAWKIVIEPLLRYSPENLHVVMSTRTAKAMHLSSLKMQGQVNQMTTTDLLFTPFETEELLEEKLNKKMLLEINKKTEGWPAALQLIKSAMSGHSDYNIVINNFTGTEQNTREYILEHILNKLPEQQKELLLDISIFDQFEPEAIDRIRETTNSGIELKDLESLNRLISRSGDNEQTYHLHPLFRQSLLYYFEQSNPERMKLLHLRAADMFREQGHIIQSIQHALLANEPETAANFLEQAGGILLWNREGMTRIRKAHALLPEHIIKTHPRLSLLRALILLKDGNLNDARNIYNKVCLELESEDQPHSAELDYDLAVITSTIAVYEGTPLNEDMSDRLVSSIERFKEIDKLQIGFVYTILCVFNLQKGDFLKAREVGNKAISYFQKHQSLFGETYIYVHLGVIATAEGKLDQAHENYKKVQDALRRYFIDDKDLRLIINILMAEWHYERNELNNAARLLKDINHRLETGEAWYEIYATAYSTSTALAYMQKGLGACLNLSDDATSYIRQQGLKRLNRLVLANTVGYLCRAGKIKKARMIVQENNLNFMDYKRSRGVYFSLRECYGVVQALARLLIAEKRFDDAIGELHAQIKDHQSTDETRAIQKYSLLLSIALFGKGEKEAAFRELEPVLSFVRNNGFLRFILDEEPFILPLLETYILNSQSQEVDHAQYLLELLNETGSPQNQIALSRREKQVLDQLTEGYSDKTIARNLDVSENTIRFHLKNLFGKLNVNSRLKAVSEAAKHNLLK